MAVGGVECELISPPDSLISKENTGNFFEFGPLGAHHCGNFYVDPAS